MFGHRPRPIRRLPLVLAAVSLLAVAALLPALGTSAPTPGVGLMLGSDGSITTQLTTVDPNGSALRYAMDGNFEPLVYALPGNNSTKATLLATINATESNPLLAGLFGDHDGQVDAYVDVPRFQSLILNEAKLIPSSTLIGALNISLDATPATTVTLQGVSFSGAEGPDSSIQPIGISATLLASFAWSGVDASHVLEVAWNLPALVGNLSVGAAAVNLSFTTPNAVTIVSATGMAGTQIENDPLGWGPARVSGEYTPLAGHVVTIDFGPAFPTGDALLLGAVAVAAGAIIGTILVRRRRGRSPSGAPPPGPLDGGGPGVGPSSGSG
jgi:hypothetical protein